MPFTAPHQSRRVSLWDPLLICVIEFRRDGRLSLADPKVPPGGSSETTPDRRRPRAPAVVPRQARRLPCVGHATYGSVFVSYRHLGPRRFYEALHSMRRVCSCNPPWVRNYHEDMGWGPYSDRPCDCGCPWRHGEYRPSWPWGVIDHVDPGYGPSVRLMDRLRAVVTLMTRRLSTTRIGSVSFSACSAPSLGADLLPGPCSRGPVRHFWGPGFVLGRVLSLPSGGRLAGGPRWLVGGARR